MAASRRRCGGAIPASSSGKARDPSSTGAGAVVEVAGCRYLRDVQAIAVRRGTIDAAVGITLVGPAAAVTACRRRRATPRALVEVLMPFGIGFGEMVLIFAVLLLVFGAKRLPEIGGAMGKSIRDFKRSINGLDEASIDRSIQSPASPQQIPDSAAQAQAQPSSQEANAERPQA
jgi:sec-independent protein translocase protein TatA